MWIHNLDPVLVHLGFLQIRWYGLVYVLGFLLGIWWLQQARKKGQLAITEESVWDLIFYLMLGVIIGSRLFMIFWNPEIYFYKPWNLLYIWQGGMSFHGGFVGIMVACWYYCKKKQLNFWTVADILAVPAIFALALGRIANFINGELVGRVWNGRWCVVFPDYGPECRHPNMIYSAVQRLAVFGWLWFLSVKKDFKAGQVTSVRDLPLTPFRAGFIFWNFVFWEGIGRFIVDFYRHDLPSNYYFSLSLGQWFSLIMILIAGWVFWKRYMADWKRLLNHSTPQQ